MPIIPGLMAGYWGAGSLCSVATAISDAPRRPAPCRRSGHVHIFDQDPSHHAVKEDHPSDDGQHDACRGAIGMAASPRKRASQADGERPVAVGKKVNPQLVGARPVVDRVVFVAWEPRGRTLRLAARPGLGGAPGLEGGGRQLAGGPQLVSAVAAVVDEPGRSSSPQRGQSTARSRVGYVDISWASSLPPLSVLDSIGFPSGGLNLPAHTAGASRALGGTGTGPAT